MSVLFVMMVEVSACLLACDVVLELDFCSLSLDRTCANKLFLVYYDVCVQT